ncbi:HK97 family phage prohead protease [Sphingomonas sp. ST-64]|uniref:HK97 family phage prohead protease n=1 Tax=Sphingomonas plantiphila TaxID=3163295 RepID=A0ABW8YL63_9SPHN
MVRRPRPWAPAFAGEQEKAWSGPVRFAGYAAVFDAPDRGGDVIRSGAFGDAVRRVPLLWQHRGQPVGVIEAIGADARGLRVTGRVDAPELATLVATGAVSGLSFGYRTVKARQGRWREIMALELCEVSLVARPMQPHARVHAVAAAPRPMPGRMGSTAQHHPSSATRSLNADSGPPP